MKIHNQLDNVLAIEQRLQIKKGILLDKALHSSNPSDILKANSILVQNVDQKVEVDRKSFLIDPYQFNNFLGYKDKPYSLSYNMLKKISYQVPIVRGIIGTRIDQVTAYCEPQKDKYSIGFVVRLKKAHFNNNTEAKISKEQAQKIEEITEFILNCGTDSNSFANDDFDTFVRKIMNDSLTYDQMVFEVTRNRKGKPDAFYAVDAATIRVADSFDDDKMGSKLEREVLWASQADGTSKARVKGYMPSYCQIKDSVPVADFYPWEMMFGVRNPQSNIYSNGYGVSEIEILTNTITSMLWSDEYNRKFFSQGSAPKGLLKIKSGTALGSDTLSQFRQQWQSMMSGVQNSWKTPILEGDVDWVDLQKSNNDMEFAKWQEYLIKLTTCIFRIDPAEINFPLSGGSEAPMFEGNNEARMKHSKDKGLYPLLKFLQRKINKFIVSQLDPRFEFVFEGLDVDNPKDELEADVKMMSNFMTIDEVRVRRGLKPLGEEKGGNVIANSVWMQKQQADAMAKQQEQMANQGGGMGDEEGQPQGDEDNYEEDDDDANPFEKAFNNYIETLK